MVTAGDRNICFQFLTRNITTFLAVLDQDQGKKGFLAVCLKSLAISLVMSLYLGRQKSGYAIFVAGYFFFQVTCTVSLCELEDHTDQLNHLKL